MEISIHPTHKKITISSLAWLGIAKWKPVALLLKIKHKAKQKPQQNNSKHLIEVKI